MNIKNMKAEVLAALYNNSKPQGLGFLHYTSKLMTKHEAQTYLDKLPNNNKYVDYLNGRVIKVDFTTDEIKTYLYNRNNGTEAAERIINSIGEED